MQVSAVVSEDLTVPMTATGAIIVYEGRSSGKDMSMAAFHAVNGTPEQDTAPEIGPGTPLDRRTIELILRKVQGQDNAKVREMIPSELLYFDEKRMVWHVPAATRPAFFRTGRPVFDTEMNGQRVLWPNLLFVAEPGSLKVFALASADRPTPATPVYLAPAYNLYLTGGMCAGNVRLPDVLSVAGRERWEQCFFDTEFTHSNYQSKKLTTHPGGHDGLWKAMRWRQAFRGYPAKYLVAASSKRGGSAPLTVGEVISA